mmetsp:Transcript_10436/g.29264  ORF Transcript_10436/g.29264 Transcript_10436/m.29264 type:complete len:286 (+) Transcript_10436:52-909(+)|eukprot:CAMPEP_0119149168 /NCGR_PEP_ID=MMETSP1310-20130426/42955_1 /TAXON_ID=464262 /ORGANISM="Genus nov. species nov., Strain RCC2339" /LENGTH=285 /DNA_ID=CAMNT_0007141257 /DNA_START=81 /DNA_END=938 /DNA_ORIENTATION=+
MDEWGELLAGKYDVEKKWLARTPGLERAVVRGVPAEIRGRVWMRLLPTAWLQERYGRYGREMWEAVDADSKECIEKDVPRTFPELPGFGLTNAPALRRILSALAALYPEVGYRSGRNFVVGTILRAIEEEEDAFWISLAVFSPDLPGWESLSTFGTHEGMVRAYRQFADQLKALHPALSDHLCLLGFQPELHCATGTVTLLTHTLPPTETVLRYMDLFVYFGLPMVVRLQIAALALDESRFLACQNFEDALDVFGEHRQLNSNSDAVIHLALSQPRSLAPRCAIL